MYDDFMAGYNSGNGLTIGGEEQGPVRVKSPQLPRPPLQNLAGTYDKSKMIKMRGPNGEEGELYADGRMYIIFPDGKAQKRKFGSRPYGIRYMQKRGWVVV